MNSNSEGKTHKILSSRERVSSIRSNGESIVRALGNYNKQTEKTRKNKKSSLLRKNPIPFFSRSDSLIQSSISLECTLIPLASKSSIISSGKVPVILSKTQLSRISFLSLFKGFWVLMTEESDSPYGIYSSCMFSCFPIVSRARLAKREPREKERKGKRERISQFLCHFA